MPRKDIELAKSQSNTENLIDTHEDLARMDEILDDAVIAIGLNVSPKEPPKEAPHDASDAIALSDDDLIVDEKSISSKTSSKKSVPPFTKTLWRRKIEMALLRKSMEKSGALIHPLLRRHPKGTKQEMADAMMDIRKLTQLNPEGQDDIGARPRIDEALTHAPPQAVSSVIQSESNSASSIGPIGMIAVCSICILISGAAYYWMAPGTPKREAVESDVASLQAEYDRLRAQITSKDEGDAVRSTAKTPLSSRKSEPSEESTADKIKAKLRASLGGGPTSTVLPGIGTHTGTRFEMKQTMERITPSVRACAKKKKHGLVTISVEIDPSGQVLKSAALGGYAGTAMGECAAKVVGRTRFPESEKAITIKHAFSF